MKVVKKQIMSTVTFTTIVLIYILVSFYVASKCSSIAVPSCLFSSTNFLRTAGIIRYISALLI